MEIGRRNCPGERQTGNMTTGTVATFANVEVIEDAYRRWKADPDSVDESWRWFFQGFELGSERPAGGDSRQGAVVRLIYAYRDLGHFLAHLDPLSEVRA